MPEFEEIDEEKELIGQIKDIRDELYRVISSYWGLFG